VKEKVQSKLRIAVNLGDILRDHPAGLVNQGFFGIFPGHAGGYG
jgi:hypothetical protein